MSETLLYRSGVISKDIYPAAATRSEGGWELRLSRFRFLLAIIVIIFCCITISRRESRMLDTILVRSVTINSHTNAGKHIDLYL